MASNRFAKFSEIYDGNPSDPRASVLWDADHQVDELAGQLERELVRLQDKAARVLDILGTNEAEEAEPSYMLNELGEFQGIDPDKTISALHTAVQYRQTIARLIEKGA